MLGPVFDRELLLTPKRPKTYVSRAVYVLVLFTLLCTGYLVLAGTRPLQTAGDSARFGGWMFTLLVPLQIVVVTFQSAVGAASNIAQEKDRRTLILLLLTRLSGYELVLGKLASSLLPVIQSVVAAVPLFLSLVCLGGVSFSQFVSAYVVTIVTAVFAASVGTVIALWREKTFQTIAVTVLILVLWIGVSELVATGLTSGAMASIGHYLSPVRAIQAAISPISDGLTDGSIVVGFAATTSIISVALMALGIAKVRVWNPSRELRITTKQAEAEDEEASSWKVREARSVWSNPVLWREICTRAYGRKVLVIRFAYLLLVAIASAALWQTVQVDIRSVSSSGLPAATLPLAAIGVVSLAIVNALAVNSITNERDGLALDLLLATDLEPREFYAGKIWGVLFVTKEMILMPLGLLGFVWWSGEMSGQHLAYSVVAALVLYLFVTTLGIHCGVNYANGRAAIMTSLGTVFFLCLGIAICMVIMVSFRGAFQLQLAPFLAIILGGGAGLLASLGKRNPSPAISLASFSLPLATFYAITTFLLQRDQFWVLFAVAGGYGFATAAMLVPALADFDVAMKDSGPTVEDGA